MSNTFPRPLWLSRVCRVQMMQNVHHFTMNMTRFLSLVIGVTKYHSLSSMIQGVYPFLSITVNDTEFWSVQMMQNVHPLSWVLHDIHPFFSSVLQNIVTFSDSEHYKPFTPFMISIIKCLFFVSSVTQQLPLAISVTRYSSLVICQHQFCRIIIPCHQCYKTFTLCHQCYRICTP